METLSVITNLVIGTGTLIISIYLLVNELRMRKVSTHDLIVKAYDSVNALGLESDENLKALAEVLYPDKKNNLELLRQRLFAYVALNAIELTFLSRRHKIIKHDVADPILNDLLRSVLHNKEAQDIIEAGTYDKKFTALAKTIINDIENDKATTAAKPRKQLKEKSV
jgi:hypothetical protein